MPVILDPDAYDLWLDPGMKDVATASDLLKPYDARLMRSYPMSGRLNSVMSPWRSPLVSNSISGI
jgi:putative SOS response-associated peptidase YedK